MVTSQLMGRISHSLYLKGDILVNLRVFGYLVSLKVIFSSKLVRVAA